MLVAGGSGTSWASASAAQLASLSTNTGTPKRLPSSSRSGTPSNGMFTLGQRGAGGELHLGRHPHADGRRALAVAHHLADRLLDPVQQRVACSEVRGLLHLALRPRVLHAGHGHLGATDVDSENRGHPPRHSAGLVETWVVDRQLARRNLRTALIASVIALVVFAASFVVGFVY